MTPRASKDAVGDAAAAAADALASMEVAVAQAKRVVRSFNASMDGYARLMQVSRNGDPSVEQISRAKADAAIAAVEIRSLLDTFEQATRQMNDLVVATMTARAATGEGETP